MTVELVTDRIDTDEIDDLVITIPTDLGETPFGRDSFRTLSIVREVCANAVTWKLDEDENAKVYACLAKMADDKRWLICAMTTEPFTDLRAIRQKGCTPNQGGGKGHSCQASGLIQSAAQIARNVANMELVIGSFCGENRKFLACSGRPHSTKENEWHTADVSTKWKDELSKLFGAKFAEYNVFYAFRLPASIDKSAVKATKKKDKRRKKAGFFGSSC